MQSPNPNNSDGTTRRSWRRWLGRTLLISSGLIGIGSLAGIWWLDRFVKAELSPLLSQELSKSLNRPVLVGAVEGYSLTGVRVGKSSIPATNVDPDRAEITAIAVSFNPLQLLTRKIDLNLTFIEPNIYLEQEQNGMWVRIPVQPEQPPGILQSQITSVKVQRGTLALSPAPRPGTARQTLNFTPVNGTGIITGSNNTQKLTLDVNLQSATGGGLITQGDIFPDQGRTNLQFRIQKVALAEVGQLVQKPFRLSAADGDNPEFLPVIVQSGQVSGALAVQSRPDQVPLLTGTMDVTNTAVKITTFPEVITVSQGRVRLQGQRLQLENVNGEIAGAELLVKGGLNLQALDATKAATDKGEAPFFDLTGQLKAVSVSDLLERFDVKLPVPLVGMVRGDFQVMGALTRPVVTGNVAAASPLRVDRLTLRSIRTSFRFADAMLAIQNLQAFLSTGGQLTGNGRVSLSPEGTVQANFQIDDLNADPLVSAYDAKLPPDFTLGTLKASGTVSGSLENLRGEVRWQAPTATYPGSGRIILAGDTVLFQDTKLAVDGGSLQASGQIRNGEWDADVTTDSLQLGRLSPTLQGTVSGKVSLSGRLDALRVDAIRATGNLLLSQGLATVKQTATAGFAEPLTASFAWDGQRLVLRDVNSDRLNANGSIATSFRNNTLAVTGLDLALRVREFDLAALPLGNGRSPASGRASFTGRVRGNLTNPNVDGILAVNQLGVNQPNGAPIRFNQVVADLNWNGQQLALRNVDADGSTLRGTIATDARGGVPSKITDLDLQLRLRDYDVAILPIPPINTPQGRLMPQGRVNYTGRLTGTLDNLNLAGELNLSQVALNQPGGKPLVQWNRATFNGNVTGAVTALRARGNVRVNNLQALGLPFEPVLTGSVDYAIGKGGAIDLVGTRDRNPDCTLENDLTLDLNCNPDRILITLGADNVPTMFTIARDRSIAQGRRQGDRLQLSVTDFPVDGLQLSPVPGYGAVAGVVTGTIDYNLKQGTGVGRVTIQNPTLGHLVADRFSGNLSYVNGVATLSNGEFQIRRSRYTINASAKLGAIPQFTADVNVEQGRIRDILDFFQWFDLTDIARGLQPPTFDRASDLQIYTVGDPNALLNAQIQRLSEIDKLLSQQLQAQRSNLIPDLRNARGTFSGKIAVSSSPTTGLAATFDIKGANWQLDAYQAEKVTIQGDFKDGVLTLQPLRLASNDDAAFLTFAGPLSVGALSGQIRFQNLPLDNFIAIVDLPIPVSGKLTGTVSLAGKLLEPRFQGQIRLVEGLLNDEEIDSATANFNYGSRRVNFRTVLTIQGPEPLVIEGSLPAALPFDLAFPEKDAGRVALTANLKNEGLALLNVFSKQVSWVDGKGSLNLQVQGDLAQMAEANQSPLTITGTLALQDAIFRVQGLPDDITNVTGQASFAGDRILVEAINGVFSKGTILVKGYLPIQSIPSQPDSGLDLREQPDPIAIIQAQPAAQLPLTLSFAEIGLNLKGLYRGQAQGIIQIRGGVLDSEIGGDIRLANGLVFLSSEGTQEPDEPIADAANQLVQPPEFKNLRITLGDRVLITSPPLLSFIARGDLLLNGALNDLRNIKPNGTIRLETGQVNIGLAQLNLARGFENTATFTPLQGTDPTLNIRLVTAVQEVFRQPIATTSVTGFASSERAELPTGALGALQTVRIRAEVNGRASQLQDNLTLTSSPPRSREELISLLGGTSNLERGDSRSLEILAGTVLLTQLQGLIGNTIGLTDFRLFPTLIGSSRNQEEARRSSSSTLGLAAEIGTDITDSLSVSLLQVLGSEQPTQYNLRYRLNEEFLLRGSTDFSGDSRAVIEFSTRF